LKIGFSLLLVACLYAGFKNFTNDYEFSEILRSVKSPWYLSLIICFLFINLYCESRKWRAVTTLKINSTSALRAILAGYSTAVITPNRIGEFAGRNTFFAKQFRPELTTATFIGSFVQGAITVFFGLVGLVWFPFSTELIKHLDYKILFWILLLLAAIVVGLYFFRNYFALRLAEYLSSLQKVTGFQLLKSAFWGLVRYLTFLTQFYLALLIFGFEGSFALAASGISVMYLIQSYIPLTGLGELGVREFLSFIIFSPFMEIGVAAVFPALLIWLINIVIPSLCGLALLKSRHSFAR